MTLTPTRRSFLIASVVAGLFSAAILAPATAAAQAHAPVAARTLPAPAHPGDAGFVVVAPDRGFLGNEELRDAFAPFAERFRAELAFVPWEGDPVRFVRPAIARLREGNAKSVAVLPFFLERSHPLLERLRRAIGDAGVGQVAFADPFGASYLAEEALVDRLRAAGMPAALAQAHAHPDAGDGGGAAVLIVGAGAVDDATAETMKGELERLARVAAFYLGPKETAVEVLREREAGAEAVQASFARVRAQAERLAASHGRVLVVPFHLGQRLDTMMDVNHTLEQRLSGLPAEIVEPGPLPHDAAALWMAREANRRIPLTEAEIGYVIMPHGSTIVWNESIREPLRDLEERHPVEYAFSMADPPVLERAVRRLEARGIRGIVVVRVFALAASFRERIDFLLGISDEPGGLMNMGPPARVRSAAVFTTLGGIEDHALFARALLARAQELSQDPSREALLLVGHGSGDDGENESWLEDLASIAAQMRDLGARFAAVYWATWREDWPHKRAAAAAGIHQFVRDQRAAGRDVLVIPARTTSVGPEPGEFAGVEGVRIGTGFAPHPLFADWVSEQLEQGKRRLLGR